MPSLAGALSPLQLGGLPRVPVLFPAHIVRTFQSWCRSGSYAVLYLDLREAFCRPMLLHDSPTDEAVATIFQLLNLPPDSFRTFCDNIVRSSSFEHAEVPQWLQCTLRTVLQHTWFRLERQQDIVHTTLGSRPGDNLADVLFPYLFADVASCVRSIAEAEGLLARLPWSPDMIGKVLPIPASDTSESVPLHDVTWMDDVSLLATFRHSAEVLPGLSRLAGLLIDSCLEKGLTPNLDQGKTEAMVSVSGRDAQGPQGLFV